MKDTLLVLFCACCLFTVGLSMGCSKDDMVRKFKSSCEKACTTCPECVDEAETGCICE